jgi:hypothetical protein
MRHTERAQTVLAGEQHLAAGRCLEDEVLSDGQEELHAPAPAHG